MPFESRYLSEPSVGSWMTGTGILNTFYTCSGGETPSGSTCPKTCYTPVYGCNGTFNATTTPNGCAVSTAASCNFAGYDCSGAVQGNPNVYNCDYATCIAYRWVATPGGFAYTGTGVPSTPTYYYGADAVVGYTPYDCSYAATPNYFTTYPNLPVYTRRNPSIKR